MTTIPLRGIDFSGRILVPLHANGLLNEIQAVTNQRQKDSIVREIQKSIISIQHKLNVAFYQAVLIRSLKTDDYTLFELYPGRLSNSNVSHKICTYSMFNIDEYLLVLTFFIETFAATVFSLFDVSGSLINRGLVINRKPGWRFAPARRCSYHCGSQLLQREETTLWYPKTHCLSR